MVIYQLSGINSNRELAFGTVLHLVPDSAATELPYELRWYVWWLEMWAICAFLLKLEAPVSSPGQSFFPLVQRVDSCGMSLGSQYIPPQDFLTEFSCMHRLVQIESILRGALQVMGDARWIRMCSPAPSPSWIGLAGHGQKHLPHPGRSILRRERDFALCFSNGAV